jgi:hypothetical protein
VLFLEHIAMCKSCCRRLNYHFHVIWLTSSLVGILLHYASVKTSLEHVEGSCVTIAGMSLPVWLFFSGTVGGLETALVLPILLLVCVDMAWRNESFTAHLKGGVAILHSLMLAWYIVWTLVGLVVLTQQCEEGDVLVTDLSIVQMIVSGINGLKICIGLFFPVRGEAEVLLLQEHAKARRYLNSV